MKAILRVKRTDRGAMLPECATSGACGLDLRAVHDVTLRPGERAIVRTGLAMAIPKGCYGLVAGRSGLFVREGLLVVPGYIDSDYRGEVGVMVLNTSDRNITIARDDRCAQLIIHEHPCVEVEESDTLDDTARGGGGFGSTGKQ